MQALIARQRLAILPVSKALTNKFYIYRQCTYIVYWFHLVQLFQRSRLKYNKLTDGRRMPSDGNTSHDPLGQVS
jgi:hypothetical protein